MNMKLFAICFLFVSCCTILCQSQANETSSTTQASSTTHGGITSNVTEATSTTVSGGNATQSSTAKVTTTQAGTTEKNGSAIVSALPLIFSLVPMVLLRLVRF